VFLGGITVLGRRLFGLATPAVEFPVGAEWLNTDHPLKLEELRGKVVLLDFWTYCCINCMHVIPELRRLEERYPELVVIGVHSAKFENERVRDNIAAAILRYGIEHPVLVDNDFVLWHSYGINAWPSFVLIDPAGNVATQASGEGVYELFDESISTLSKAFRGQGLLKRDRMRFALLKDRAPTDLLSFPGKLAADEKGLRLFLSDSNHDRVLVLSPDGEVQQAIGSGARGRDDGDLATATFDRPQGLAYDPAGDALYVADTENHLVRRVDLKAGRVTTVLGNGRQGGRTSGGTGTQVSLSSPWDLAIVGENLYIAMAGTHTIWRMHTRTLEAERYAGSGMEGIRDGPLRQAALAQPSGIASDGGGVIYFADSEVSAVRALDGDRVRTLVGEGLFEFGDRDGDARTARLQHPIGIAVHEGLVYVADTYNHRVKVVDPREGTVMSLVGTGRPGRADGPAAEAQLSEPNGLAFLDDMLYIADTNNNLVRVYEPATGLVNTLALRQRGVKRAGGGLRAKQVELPRMTVSPRARSLRVRLEPPEGHVWNPDAPNRLAITAEGKALELGAFEVRDASFDHDVPIKSASAGEGALVVEAVAYFCEGGADGLCRFGAVTLHVPIAIEDGAPDAPVIDYRFELP
jgi:DNA-binding beta-propeller fold protein YncE